MKAVNDAVVVSPLLQPMDSNVESFLCAGMKLPPVQTVRGTSGRNQFGQSAGRRLKKIPALRTVGH